MIRRHIYEISDGKTLAECVADEIASMIVV